MARPMGSLFNLFLALPAFVWKNCFPQKVPFHFFDVLRQNGYRKSPKGSVSFGFVRFVSEIKIFPFFSFLMFCERMYVENCQRVTLSILRHGETFFRNVFSPKGPLFYCDKNCDNFKSDKVSSF